MKYVGLQSQIWKNNTRSVLLLIMFPVILYALTWLFFFIISLQKESQMTIADVNNSFLRVFPFITAGVIIWFIVAYFSHSAMIRAATGSKPLERKENKRVYNLVENL
ncbi:MAG TPA: protease, partial [Bacteroidales bacterium]|nr:protease [Bacteroidales bacterium]